MITIQAFSDIINAELVIRRYPNQDNRWTADFDGCEIKGDGVLESAYGDGTTAAAAIAAYVERIRGKTLVFNATTDRRREYVVPIDIEI